MKTGKRKTQKYMSAILIAAMSMSHVTGVWAEPVNTQEIAEEKALSEEEGKKQEEALPEEGEKLEEEVLQEDEEEKTEEGAAAESVPALRNRKRKLWKWKCRWKMRKLQLSGVKVSNWKNRRVFLKMLHGVQNS